MSLLNEEKKYRLTRKCITLENGTHLYQIKALNDFADVRKGQLGGYVQCEDNLSQEDDCWIYDKAKVYDYAKVEKNAKVFDNVKVHGYALVSDCARIYNKVDILDHACIYDYSVICDSAVIKDHAILNCHAQITKNAIIKDDHDFYTGYLDSRHDTLHRKPITVYYTPKHEVRVVYKNTTHNLQGFIEDVRKILGFISYAEDFRPQLVNARRRMYFKEII